MGESLSCPFLPCRDRVHCAGFTQRSNGQETHFINAGAVQLNLIKGLTKSSVAFYYVDIFLAAWKIMPPHPPPFSPS